MQGLRILQARWHSFASLGRPGRKPKGGGRYSLKLTDAVADYYRGIGGGGLTLGIERVAALGIERKESGLCQDSYSGKSMRFSARFSGS